MPDTRHPGYGCGVSSLALVFVLMGANPDWPPMDPGLSPNELAEPQRWPDDPGYGPDDDCRGQWGLFSFTPPCAAGAQGEDAVGARVDRAWLWTVGRPEVAIATLDDGPHPDEADLISQWRLNTGELAPPRPSGPHDVNGDGVFDVRDYTTATGTEATTLDRVNAPDLVARPDHGDINGNGWLDPQDILQIYADGRDDDGNGFIDDICGWDFVDDDHDPFDGPSTVGPAHWALARANNGVGLAGACPNCSGLPLRVAEHGATTPAALALALLYAADRDARVAMVAAATWGDRPALHRAVDYAERQGLLVVLGRGRQPGRSAPVTWPSDTVLQVGAIGPDTDDFTVANRFDVRGLCSGLDVAIAAPGRCDGGSLGIAAGVAGLVWTAAAGLPDRDRPAWATLPTPRQVRAILGQGTRNDPRLDARAAVDATLDRFVPTPAVIEAPAVNAVIDPSKAAAIMFRARLATNRSRPVNWRLEAGPGLDAPRFVLVQSGRTEAGDPPDIEVSIPSIGWTDDPTAAVRSSGAFALTIRLTTRTDFDDQTAQISVQRTVHVHRDSTLLPAFPIQLPAGVTGATRVIDLDNDGTANIVVTTQDGQLLAVSATGAVSRLALGPVWPALDPERASSHGAAPALTGDVPGAWRDGLVAGPTARRFNGPDHLWALTYGGAWIRSAADGTVRTGTTTAGPRTWSPLVLDSTDGGYFVDDNDRLYALTTDGDVRSGFPVELSAQCGSPAVGDVDDNGSIDIFVACQDQVWRVAAEGHDADRGPVPSGWPTALPASTDRLPWGLEVGPGPTVTVGDIDDDNTVDIIVAVAGRPLIAVDLEGGQKAIGPPQTSVLTGAVAIGSLDEPELPWALLATGRRPAADAAPSARAGAFLWPDISVIEPYPIPWGDVLPLEPVLIDLDGDDRPEALWPEGPDRLRAVDRDGNPPQGWPKLTGDEIVGAPAVGDLDGDGFREVVVATRRGRVFAWRTPAETFDAAPWDGHRHDIRASGDLRSPTRPVPFDNDGCGCATTARGDDENRTRPWLGLVLLLMLRARSSLARRTR